jgi:hypothetical protein
VLVGADHDQSFLHGGRGDIEVDDSKESKEALHSIKDLCIADAAQYLAYHRLVPLLELSFLGEPGASTLWRQD